MKLKKLLYIMIPAAIVITFSAFYNVSGAAICLTGSLATNSVSGDTTVRASTSYSMADINDFETT